MKTGKFSRLTSLLLAVMMVAGLITVMPTAAMAAEPGISSTGYDTNGKFLAPIGEPDPSAIPIYTAQDLDNVRNDIYGSYVLMNDIDLADFNGGEWESIGGFIVNPETGQRVRNDFRGTFDGQGHVVKNMQISEKNLTGYSVSYDGLFGMSHGTIINVGIEGNSIRTDSTLFGCISGGNYGTIGNCYSTVSITAVSSKDWIQVGGISGESWYGEIIDCYNTGSIYAEGVQTYAGGIVGTAGDEVISNCYNTGDIYAKSSQSWTRAGGTCGAFRDDGIISRCYNTGDVLINDSVSGYAGGICGEGPGGAVIRDCYNTGSVHSFVGNDDWSDSCAGGISGYDSYGDGNISNCYSTGSIFARYSGLGGSWGNDNAYAGGISGVIGARSNSDPSLVTACVVLSDDISAENTFYPYDSYSFLIGAVNGTKSGNLALYGIPGNAEDDADRRISLAEAKSKATYEALGWDFDNVWIMVPGYDFPQLRGMYNDIAPIEIYTAQDLDDVRNNLSGSYLLMNDIDLADFNGGEWTTLGYFEGVFDGQGHVINNMTITETASSPVALFYWLEETAIVKNVGLENIAINAPNGSGIAFMNQGIIKNCYTTGSIIASSEAAGICLQSYGTITDCYNTASINVTNTNSFVAAGGVSGYNFHSGTINNCYNTGNIEVNTGGSLVVGGICGINWGVISNCVVMASSISAYGSWIDCGLISYDNISHSQYEGVKTNNLALEGISGNAEDDADRRISLAEAKSKATYEALGWDFDNVWIMVPGYDYPLLFWKDGNVGEPIYNPGDIAVINAIIDNNSLNWTKADPADGSYAPDDWTGVIWSNAETDKRVKSLNISARALTGALDVSGLTSLVDLHCTNNQLSTLDVSGLTELYNVTCYSSELTGINVSGLASLGLLSCFNNQLSTLDVSGLTSLGYIYCNNNQLSTLDVSGLTSLRVLSCGSNQLSTLDVRGLTLLGRLTCDSNQLSTLNVSGLTSLGTLSCNNNQLSTLNVSGLISLEYLSCDSNQLSMLDVSGLTSLEMLFCSDNDLTGLVLYEAAPYSRIDARYNYMADESAVTGKIIDWDISGFVFWPQKILLVDSIAITEPPTKTVYFVGDTLDLADMIVTATYKDKSTEAITDYTTDPADGAELNVVGQQTVTVSYEGETATFTVTVNTKVCAHIEDSGTVTTPATCQAEGVMTFRCTLCQEVLRTAPIPKLAHIEDSGTVTTPATCQADGEMTFKCTLCQEVLRTAPIPKLAHIEDSGTITTPATCESEGVMTFKCTLCQEVLRTAPIPKLAHDFSVLIDHKEATATEDGYDVFKCSRCEETKTIVIPKTGDVTIVSVATTAKDFISMVETAKNSRIWILTFNVTLTYSDGTSEVVKFSILLDGNNANQNGTYTFDDNHILAGYTLVYDIKGNGSNIKDFKIIQK